MKKAAFAVLFAASLAACSQDATAPSQAPESGLAAASANVTLDQPFTLRVGRSATVAGEGLTVSFEAVPSDSRCPTGVQCVWAGDAVVQVVLSKDGKAFGAELHTNLEPTSVDYLNYNVRLVSLDPYPSSTNPIPQSQYRATFVVTKTAP
ncbi:MAG TPA: hypothetical protein VEQ60_08160 [Longimicrobium sp.]|nr:hypothetical protein [Longimicrobium sp.]